MWRNLLLVGNTGFDGDIGGQENIMRPEVYKSLAKFVHHCYSNAGEQVTREDMNVRIALLSTLVHYYILLGNRLYRVAFGNPSGNFITAFLCSYCSALIIRCAYFSLATKHERSLATVFSFNSLVKDALSGDDNVVIRSSQVSHFFNGRSVSLYCKSLNIEYTDASKASVFPPDRDFKKLWFLGCRPVPCKYKGVDMFMAWIQDSSLIKCISFVRTTAANGDPYVAIVDNANTSLRLVWTSGKQRFEDRRSMLTRIFKMIDGKSPNLMTYDHCIRSYEEGNMLDDEEHCELSIIPHVGILTKATEILLSPSKWSDTLNRGIKLMSDRVGKLVPLAMCHLSHQIDLPTAKKRLLERIDLISDCKNSQEALDMMDSSTAIIVTSSSDGHYLVIEGNGRVSALQQRPDFIGDFIQVQLIKESYSDDDRLLAMEPEIVLQMDNGISTINANGESQGGLLNPNVASSQSMGETQYSFSSLANRMQLIKTVTWTTQQVQGAVFFSLPIPFGVVGKTTQDAFNKFLYWNGDVEITLQIQSNSFQQGKVALVFAPYCSVSRANKLQLDSLTSISVAPHVQLFAGQSTQVKMIIPYSHFKNYLETSDPGEDDFNTLGCLSLVVFNPLRLGPVGDGVEATEYCTINLYSNFPRVDFQMLRPPPITPSVPPITSVRTLKTKRTEGKEDFQFVMQGGSLSSLGTNVSDTISDSVDMMEKVGALAALAADKPNVGMNYTPFVNRGYPMLNHSENIAYANVLGIKPGVVNTAEKKDVGVAESETTVKEMMCTMSYMNTFTVKTSDVEGTIYAVIPMCPNPKILNAPLNSDVQVTMCGYTSLMSKFWKGGLRLNVEVICTGLHTMRLVVASHYGTSSSQVDQNSIMSQNATILEVGSGQNHFSVDIPWRSNLELKEVCGGSVGMNSQTVGENQLRYTMGEVSVRLMTGLQAMQSVSPEVDVNLYWSCMEDITLEYPGFTYNDMLPVMGSSLDTETSQEIKLQMMSEVETGPVDMQEMKEPTSIAAGDQKTDKDNYTERLPDLMDYAKRYYPFANIPAKTQPIATVYYSVASPMITGVDNVMSGSMAWLSGCFAAWKGAIRFQMHSKTAWVIFADATERMVVSDQPCSFYRGSIAGGGPFDTMKPGGFLSLQVPCTIPRKFNIIPKIAGEENFHECTSACVAIDAEEFDKDSEKLYVKAAAGDNFCFMKRFMVPKVRITGSYYLHNWNSDPPLPQYVEMIATAGAPAFPFSGATIMEYIDTYVATGSIGLPPTTFRIDTSVLDDAQLVSLGVVLTAPLVRTYAEGQILSVPVDLSTCELRSMKIQVAQGGTGTPASYDLAESDFLPMGTTFEVLGLQAATSWFIGHNAYLLPSVRFQLTPPVVDARIIIPTTGLDYAPNQEPDIITVLTSAATAYKGGSLFRWNDQVGKQKSFFDTRQIPFK